MGQQVRQTVPGWLCPPLRSHEVENSPWHFNEERTKEKKERNRGTGKLCFHQTLFLHFSFALVCTTKTRLLETQQSPKKFSCGRQRVGKVTEGIRIQWKRLTHQKKKRKMQFQHQVCNTLENIITSDQTPPPKKWRRTAPKITQVTERLFGL